MRTWIEYEDEIEKLKKLIKSLANTLDYSETKIINRYNVTNEKIDEIVRIIENSDEFNLLEIEITKYKDVKHDEEVHELQDDDIVIYVSVRDDDLAVHASEYFDSLISKLENKLQTKAKTLRLHATDSADSLLLFLEKWRDGLVKRTRKENCVFSQIAKK